MSSNDENTRATAHAVGDQLATLFTHFLSGSDASWDDFSYGSSDLYLERLKLGLDTLSMCVQTEIHRRIVGVEPTELGV